MENKICVYAICKNEYKFLDKWLESMSEADYIVVLDTGSTDGTYEFLKSDSRVTDVRQVTIEPFRFDIARNESLKLIPDDANILFCTDLDEVLEPGWGDLIRNSWSDDTLRAKYTYIWDHTETGDAATIFLYDKLHTRDYKWYYPVHEVLGHVDNINNRPEDELGKTLDLSGIVVLHHYQDTSKERSNYLPLLELRCDENYEDSYSQYLLGREYALNGDYSSALDIFENLLELKSLIDYPLIQHATLGHMGDIHRLLNQDSEAILCYTLQIQNDPTYREPYVCLAEIYLNLELYEVALGYIKQIFDGSVYRHFDWSERSETWNEKPYDIMSIAYTGIKDYKKAAEYAIQALQYAPLDRRIQQNYLGILNQLKVDKEN